MSITFNDDYINKTVNKDTRKPSEHYRLRCWHETANGSGNPHSTLKWNIGAEAKSSYDVLIARDGEVWRYVDWRTWNSWSEGLSSWTLDGKLLTSTQLGRAALGIELDGANNGKMKATSAQIESAARFAIFTAETEGIPLDGDHDVTHAEIAPGRKTDPKGYTIKQIYEAIADIQKPPEPDWQREFGDVPFFPDSGFGQAFVAAHRADTPLGRALTKEFDGPEPSKVVYQRFQEAILTWTELADVTVYRKEKL